ncbi:MAG TPA: hypothetical protein VMH82_11160 [Myxococcota bacterium]|nr:hypothetical protein [Myxococcota bacterium]
MPRIQRTLAAALATALLLAAAPARAEATLEIFPDPARLTALLLLFLLLIPLANGLLFRPVLAVLDEREARIGGARARAADLARQAGALVQQHDEAVRAARAAASAERAGLLEQARQAQHAAIGEARQASEREIAAARNEVGAAVQAARGALARDAEPLAREIATQLLGRSLA